MTVRQAAKNSDHSALQTMDGEQQQLGRNHEYQITPMAMPLCVTLSPSIRADLENYLSRGDTQYPLDNSTATWAGSGLLELVETSSDESCTIDELWKSIMADF